MGPPPAKTRVAVVHLDGSTATYVHVGCGSVYIGAFWLISALGDNVLELVDGTLNGWPPSSAWDRDSDSERVIRADLTHLAAGTVPLGWMRANFDPSLHVINIQVPNTPTRTMSVE